MLEVTVEAIKVGSGTIIKLKAHERAKNTVRNHEKHLRGILWRKLLFIDCETRHKSVFSVIDHCWAKGFSGMFPF